MTRSNEAAEAYQRAADAEARAERMERLLHAERELLSQTKIDDEARRLAHLRSQAEAARTDREHRAQRAREEVEAGEALRESLEQAVEAAAVEYVQLEKGRDARQRRDALGRELQRINALVERRVKRAEDILPPLFAPHRCPCSPAAILLRCLAHARCSMTRLAATAAQCPARTLEQGGGPAQVPPHDAAAARRTTPRNCPHCTAPGCVTSPPLGRECRCWLRWAELT